MISIVKFCKHHRKLGNAQQISIANPKLLTERVCHTLFCRISSPLRLGSDLAILQKAYQDQAERKSAL